jgi:hypothetical protein
MLVDEYEKISLKKFNIKTIMPDATVLLLGKRRCFAKGTQVLMFDGNIKKIEDISVGDLVMGDDSTPRTVISSHSGIDKLYTVTNKRNESYTVNSNHILSLIYTRKKNLSDNKDRQRYVVTWFEKEICKVKTKTFLYKNKNKQEVYEEAKQFLDKIIDDRKIDITITDYLKLSKKYRDSLLGYQVPIEFEEKELDIDPYMLGYWLGDGTQKEASITTQDSCVLHYFAKNLPKINSFLSFRKSSSLLYVIKGEQFKNVLKKYNLMSSKHIPMIYKCNSRENRLKLLAGFIDADGHLGKRKDFEITQCKEHEKLLDDIIYLARSLGFSANKHIKKTSWTHKGEKKYGTAFRIHINGKGIEEIPTLIPRKKANPRKNRADTLVSSISIKEESYGEYYGLELNGNKRYVLDNFIVVHNSGKCLAKGEKVVMYDGTIKNIEDISVGDLVMGDDSTPRTVISSHSGIDKMYTVKNKRNESYIVNSQHILSLKYTGKNIVRDRKNLQKYEVAYFDKEKYKIVRVLFDYKNKNKQEIHHEAKQFLEKKEEDDIINIPIEKFMKLSKKHRGNLLGYQVPIVFEDQETDTDPYHIGFNLQNKDDLPSKYITNSREKRLLLLAGLIDSKGKLNLKNQFEINIKDFSVKLIDDIIFLTKSLGFVATIHKNDILRINGMNLNEIPTKEDNKKAVHFKSRKNILFSPISVQEIGNGEYFGIELDGNHRYILGNCIVTHNSWLVRDIFYHHRHIPSGVVFSGTEEASPFFSDFIPDCFIHSEYDPALIESIMNRQKRKIRETKQSGKSDTGKLPGNNLFIVLDDMLHDAQNWKKEKTIKNIFFNGRHYNFLFILTMQYPLGITPELRSNIDYVFVFNEPSVKNRKKIFDDYCGMIPSFDHFCNILDSCTQNHECLVVKTSGNTSDYKDQVFWYKAEAHTKFEVGHPKFWKYHKSNYNDKYEEDNEQDEEELLKLKKKFAKTRKLKVIVSRQGNIVGYNRDDD